MKEDAKDIIVMFGITVLFYLLIGGILYLLFVPTGILDFIWATILEEIKQLGEAWRSTQ